MSRARRRRADRRPATRRTGRLLGALVVVALALTPLVLLRGRRSAEQAPAAPASREMGPPADAYRTATALAARQRFRASLPYFRYALARLRSDDWSPHLSFALALTNATLQYTTRCGVPVPETRSSAERVRLMGEAFVQYERAAQLAPADTTRARILATYANFLYLQGFPWEAFVAYRQANLADPSNARYAREGDALMDVLRDPGRSGRAPVPGPDASAPRGRP